MFILFVRFVVIWSSRGHALLVGVNVSVIEFTVSSNKVPSHAHAMLIVGSSLVVVLLSSVVVFAGSFLSVRT